MSNILDEYLVMLRANYDAPSFQKFEQVLRDAAAMVNSKTLDMAASLVKWQTEATSAFVAVAAAAVTMVDKVAMADQEYRLFGLTMYMNADAAKKLKITLDALGQPLGVVAWDKELSERAERLESMQDKMQSALEREGFEENMKKARELRFQVSQLEVDFMYLKDAVVNGLIRAFGPQLDVLIDRLQKFNEWFADHLPEIEAKVNKYLIPILKDAWRIIKDTITLLGDLASGFADVVNIIAGNDVDEGLDKWEKFAMAIETCAHAVAWLLEKLIAVERFLSPGAATLGLGLTGAKLGSFFGPEGTAIGGIGGAVVGGVLDVIRASRKSSSGTGTSTASSNGDMAQRAAELAQSVSAKTGIAPDLLWSQWAHETGNFTNRGATSLNNLAGIKIPGSSEYQSFGSVEEFGDRYAYLMRHGGRYSGIEASTTPEEFAARLKQGGYYADSQRNYTAGMEHYERQYKGSYGGDMSMSVGHVSIQIGGTNVGPQELQARVAQGMAQGTRKEIQRNLAEFSGVYA